MEDFSFGNLKSAHAEKVVLWFKQKYPDLTDSQIWEIMQLRMHVAAYHYRTYENSREQYNHNDIEEHYYIQKQIDDDINFHIVTNF